MIIMRENEEKKREKLKIFWQFNTIVEKQLCPVYVQFVAANNKKNFVIPKQQKREERGKKKENYAWEQKTSFVRLDTSCLVAIADESTANKRWNKRLRTTSGNTEYTSNVTTNVWFSRKFRFSAKTIALSIREFRTKSFGVDCVWRNVIKPFLETLE